jgi:hypothetical protein
MYENENTRQSSSCFRYANNQTEPRVLHKNGRRFNSTALTRWINFDTHERRNTHHRNGYSDRVNQPNFGIQQRPGFFPSEVTYEFLYPKRLPSSATHKSGKSALLFSCDSYGIDRDERKTRDTNKHRRKIRRHDCLQFDIHEQDYNFEEDVDDIELITTSSDLMDENEKWSIVFEDTGKFYTIYFTKNSS